MGTCRRNWTFSAVFFSCSSLGELCEAARQDRQRKGMACWLLNACFLRAAELMPEALIS